MKALRNHRVRLLILGMIFWIVIETGCAAGTDVKKPDFADAGNWAYFGIFRRM